jgi:hypothetical protein
LQPADRTKEQSPARLLYFTSMCEGERKFDRQVEPRLLVQANSQYGQTTGDVDSMSFGNCHHCTFPSMNSLKTQAHLASAQILEVGLSSQRGVEENLSERTANSLVLPHPDSVFSPYSFYCDPGSGCMHAHFLHD